jgi:GNAT superfamily N-acetyltransferase
MLLDKSIPYFNIIMKRPAGEPPSAPAFPQGYSLRMYEPGDEHGWAEIEAAVLEFDTQEAALLHFHENYLSYTQELADRCLFIKADRGRAVATCTAWHERIGGETIPALHWVGVHPAHQGRGLGKVAVAQGIRILSTLYPGKAIWLHTQTWSWRAIGIYLCMGFEIVRADAFDGCQNDCELAFPILEGIIRPEFLDRLRNPV